MGSIATAMVGAGAQPLAPAAVVGATADTVTVVNLDTANTVNLGSQASHLPYPLGPLASVTLTAPVWAQAATAPLLVGMLPGGSNFSPGSLTITGPVTAEITGPVTVEGTVGIDGTVDVAITGTPTVDIGGTVDVAITGTPAVSISGTPTVDIASGTVDISAGSVDVTGIGGYFPPGAYSLLLNDTTTRTIGLGGSYTTAIFNVQDYQSYTAQIGVYCATQGTSGAPLCVPVIASYYANSSGSILVDTERWWAWVAAGSGDVTPLNGSGPLRGGWMSLTIGNPVATQPVTVNEINLYGAGRSLGASVWQQSPPLMTTSVTPLTSNAPLQPLPGDDRILAAESSNNFAGASTTYWLPLPLFAGTVSLYFATSATLGANFVVASAAALFNGGIVAGEAANGVLWTVAGTAGTLYDINIEVGNAPMYMVLKTTATAPTFTFTAQGS